MASPLPELDTIRHLHRVIEPIHTHVYFSNLAPQRYRECNLDGPAGYFASRSAALGAVATSVVTATFYNFAPGFVEYAMQGVWERTTPPQVLTARLGVVDGTMRDLLGDAVVESPQMEQASRLIRPVALAAAGHVEGRPLFAAHASLDWPDAPHLALWHAITLLREFRGDAHIAALLTAGLDGLDANVVNAASRQIPAEFLRTTRGWDEAQWERAVALHRETGWLAPLDGADGEPVLSDEGRMMRDEIEVATDRGCVPAWAEADPETLTTFEALAQPWSATLAEASYARLGK